MKKWLSYTIDGILVAFIGFLGYVTISMMITSKKNKGNVPSAFGFSFLYVLTDSMDDPGRSNLGQGSGIIIKSCSVNELYPSTPITKIVKEKRALIDSGVEEEILPSDYEVREDNPIVDYEKDGSIATFLLTVKDEQGRVREIPDTHRVVDKSYDEATNKWTITTMGDNPIAHTRQTKEVWDFDTKFIGKVVYDSKAFGSILLISSPAIAASAGKSAWLFPVAIIAPIVIIAGMSITDAVIKYRKEEKQRKLAIEKAMDEAGIDRNDEAAVELFTLKEEMRLEYREELEKEIEKAREEARKEKERAKKQLKKEMSKEIDREKLKEQLRKEMLEKAKKEAEENKHE
ncbi:MAG: hypothetical protein SPL02_03175 [Bacilli bacterium]|nr:hypothetical protein [Bacilli bacterium]MDY6430900.1 hypothetical protein [Bacilli bacterium]